MVDRRKHIFAAPEEVSKATAASVTSAKQTSKSSWNKSCSWDERRQVLTQKTFLFDSPQRICCYSQEPGQANPGSVHTSLLPAPTPNFAWLKYKSKATFSATSNEQQLARKDRSYFTINSCLDFGQEFFLTSASICKNCQYEIHQSERNLQEKEAKEAAGLLLAWKISEVNLKCRHCCSVTSLTSIKPADTWKDDHSKGLCVSFAEDSASKKSCLGMLSLDYLQGSSSEVIRGIKAAIKDYPKLESAC